MGHVTVGERHLVDVVRRDELGQPGGIDDRDAVRVTRACEHGRVATSRDIRDLACRESHHLDARIVAVDGVEVVKIAPRRAHDDDPARLARIAHRSSFAVAAGAAAFMLLPAP